MNEEEPILKHPYLIGNFAPVQHEASFEPCSIEGTIPHELIGGQYVRNSSNPLPHTSPTKTMHLFDGHGMLSAVYFASEQTSNGTEVRALYSNRFVRTDIFQAESRKMLQRPILPSVATMLNPRTTLVEIVGDVLRTLWMVLLSFLSGTKQSIKRISVANTSLVYHDGRVLAACESGPPMRVLLPDLKTVGWFDGLRAGGEPKGNGEASTSPGFGGSGLFRFFREWTTGHPHIDPRTGEMILIHSTFIRPFVRYSILPGPNNTSHRRHRLLGILVPGVSLPHMIHDFAVSHNHTIIIDMPLSLNPFNLLRNEPIICFHPKGMTRLGIFPRYAPHQVQWVTTEACCIFHTVNTWDTIRNGEKSHTEVNMLVCRMTSPSIIFASGNLPVPEDQATPKEECRLYYYQIALNGGTASITQQWALSAIPFELPHVPKRLAMSATKFVYGCSSANGSYASQLSSWKISSLVKVNVQELISRGLANPPTSVTGCVDTRQVHEILADNDPNDPIQIFVMPEGWYAQECVFVPREGGKGEDDGWLLTFVFDEGQIDGEGRAREDARSELWAIDARNMKDVVMRGRLPRRVPYGLHGNWFTKDEIAQQRPVETFRT